VAFGCGNVEDVVGVEARNPRGPAVSGAPLASRAKATSFSRPGVSGRKNRMRPLGQFGDSVFITGRCSLVEAATGVHFIPEGEAG
jgi:hypothetical protein